MSSILTRMPDDALGVMRDFVGSRSFQPFCVNCTEAGLEDVKVSREGTAYRLNAGQGVFYFENASDVEEWFIRKLRRCQMQEEEEAQIQVDISYPSWSETEFLYCNNDGVSEDDLLMIRKVLSDVLFFLGRLFHR